MKDYIAYFRHIIDECLFIEEVIRGRDFNDFIKDEILKRAVVRSLEVIGEAVKNIPNDIKDKQKEIPWKKIAGPRDILIHRYFGVDYANVWKVITEDLKYLKIQVEEMLKELTSRKNYRNSKHQ